MEKVIDIIIYVACAMAWILLAWFLVSMVEVTLHNLDSCVYSDWNLIKLVVDSFGK